MESSGSENVLFVHRTERKRAEGDQIVKRQTKRAGNAPALPAPVHPQSTVAKVSHTLEVDLAERLREFAFRERISESAVIEYALQRFFLSAREVTLGTSLRESGAGRRRRS
ncbi:MAG: hypothetical protein JO140_04680 [Candidatus Eremiobacteraeota bacterium]|nr:hypothetical protein [Candidatus Eremiobacteraeota bacterium]